MKPCIQQARHRQRRVLAIGTRLAASMHPIATQSQVARQLHLSTSAVQFYERTALFKVAALMLYL